jgi:hypothetical protein
MAAPHISGVVALMRQVNPDITVQQIKQILYDTAFDLGNVGEDNTYGWGMVDAYESVLQAEATISLNFTFPDGLPYVIDSEGGSTVRVSVSGTVTAPVPGTGKLHYSTGGEFTEIAMQELSANEYEAVFPSFPCPTTVSYYFSADADNGDTVTDPYSAPDETYSAEAWVSSVFAFDDNFETDLGWHVQNGLSTGGWQRGAPAGSGKFGDPTEDADGSGQCYVTGLADGEDLNNGSTLLFSPIMDASDPDARLGYWLWFHSTTDAVPAEDLMRVRVSDNGGLSWVDIETVGPNPATDGRWIRREYLVADLPGTTNTDRLRLVISAEDNFPDSTVEAGVDGVDVHEYVCDQPACAADLDGNGAVDVNDFLALLAAWGPNPGHPADFDGSGTVDVNDCLQLLSEWGPCP